MTFNVFSDNRGDLIPIEFHSLPFEPKRLFIVKNIPKLQTRGKHAHYTTKQIIFCVQGSVEVQIDDGKRSDIKKIVQGQSIYIPNKTWGKQKYLQNNTIVLVLCSTLYDKDDYIDDYNEFLELTEKIT